MATDEGGELRRGEHVVNQNTDSPRVVTGNPTNPRHNRNPF